MTDHPATFNDDILAVIDEMLGDANSVLDPFAGAGGIHQLEHRLTFGVEIEKEWADLHPTTYNGSALDLPWEAETFDAIATSPTYGNRMADQYDGRDGSKRATYRIALGHDLAGDNSGALQWGPKYRFFHEKAWAEAVRVLRPGGRFILNIKDHIRRGKRQAVTEWHITALSLRGLVLEERRQVPCSGNRFGANSDLRIDYEEVILFAK